MIPWEEIERAEIPGGGGEIVLRKRGTEFSIRTATTELMNSRLHGSEEALAELTCNRLYSHTSKTAINMLIGGLGMGYTLRAALTHLTPDSRITVCELIPAVVRWNHKHLGHLTQMVLDDHRIAVHVGDVVKVISKETSFWDAIVLDVDNGPDGLTRKENDRLYDRNGLKSSFSALRPGGILSVWSYGPDEEFSRRLLKCGFTIDVVTARAHKPGKGRKHTIWLARKPS